MKKYVIIVAGGKGLRMGGEVPKQFIPVGGKPVLMRTIEAFYAYDEQIQIVLVLPVAQQEYWKTLCEEYSFTLLYRLANGGETRFHSVKSGLDTIPANEEALVAVHDGVRPFVSAEVIGCCYVEAARTQAVVPVTDVVETVRHLEGDGRSTTVSRDDYKLVQTPQVFTLSLLKEAYAQPYIPAFTDDASVVESLGHEVTLVQGNRENIKITTPFDLVVAEAMSK
ncbi:MAG: 2-C-methyl-D-erythritol 4-phosphate cytidylyltransferase [Bacteroidaceae bacterium]|nr:2-C-methyl-D-erythritol 4-phosphate cytidylyltransferase [Bacteroidaceae bacterium]